MQPPCADMQVITGTAYAQRLKTQFEKIYGLPQWAHTALASAAIAGERSTQPVGLLQTSARLVSRRGLRLPPSTIDVSLARPVNQAAPSEVASNPSRCFLLLLSASSFFCVRWRRQGCYLFQSST